MTFGLIFFIGVPGHGFGYPQNESEFPIRSSGPIKFDLDLCQFAGVGDTTRIEIYYSVYLTGHDSIKIEGNNYTTLDVFTNTQRW